MSTIGQPERATQNRVIALFHGEPTEIGVTLLCNKRMTK